MKNIGIIPNITKDINLDFTKIIVNETIKLGANPFLFLEIAKRFDMPHLGLEQNSFFKSVDFILALGGDGTILGAAKNSAIFDKPLLGINLGTLGYLADVEKTDALYAISKVLNNEHKLEKRMMLEAVIANENTIYETKIALNDVCITKSVFNKMISLDLTINNEFIDTYRCDGIIVSTPTGSTAYNLSAGGPILKPDGEMIALTPICPQKIYAKSFVISSSDTITIKLSNYTCNEAVISLDGQNTLPFKFNSVLTLKKSKYYTTTIKTNDLSFYDILRKKMIVI